MSAPDVQSIGFPFFRLSAASGVERLYEGRVDTAARTVGEDCETSGSVARG
jgi:hypothetical protein